MAAGKNRETWRIREFLHDLGKSMLGVARELGVKHHSQVRETITGQRNHHATLQYLLDLGCPEKWLDLPEDMKAKARRAA